MKLPWTPIVTAAAAVAACSGGDESTASPAAGEKVLHVYNWNDYIGRTTIADFEARTGIKVVYDTYDSNEIVETKLLTGRSGYDVAFPTATLVGRLSRAGALMKLDKAQLPNLAHMDPEVMRQVAVNDPGNAHSIPYMWGTTGIGYNPELVRKAIGTDRIDSWAAVMDPAIASRLASCGITMLDAPDDIIEVAEYYLGTDTGNDDLAEVAAAEAALLEVRPYVRSFDSTQFINALAAGDVCVSVSWNNLALQARQRGAEAARPVRLEYVIPKEGASIWFDTAVIPVDAPHPDNAHAFLNFLMEPEVIAAISNDIHGANGSLAALEYLDPEVRDDPATYPPPEARARLHPVAARSQEYSRALNRAWTRVKAGE